MSTSSPAREGFLTFRAPLAPHRVLLLRLSLGFTCLWGAFPRTFLKSEPFKIQSWMCLNVKIEKLDTKVNHGLATAQGASSVWVTTPGLDHVRP